VDVVVHASHSSYMHDVNKRTEIRASPRHKTRLYSKNNEKQTGAWLKCQRTCLASSGPKLKPQLPTAPQNELIHEQFSFVALYNLNQ
jgi:hypothetical protein